MTEYKLDPKYTCKKCGQDYGKTDLMVMKKELWLTCGCSDKDKIYCIDPAKIKFDTMDFTPVEVKND